MNTIDKLVLGTVQFGLDYGINNQVGKVSSNEILSILSVARSAGIRYLDTSSAYGESETALGQAFAKNPLDFSVITKYPKGEASVRESLEGSLKRLGTSKVYGFLVHHFDHFQSNPSIWDEFESLKREGLVSKIGFSLYHPGQLLELMERGIAFDLLQFPYNLFDRQFEPYLASLHQSGVEIHTRSVFLQGLFFKDLETLGGRLEPLRPYLAVLREHCARKERNLEQLALGFVANSPYVDGILIGVDSVNQLQDNIKALNTPLDESDLEFIHSLNIKETELLNPVNWK